MKQHLFALYGRGDSGKTCTIKDACRQFVASADAPPSVSEGNLDGEGDIVYAVTKNGTKVGFSSSGDNRAEVEKGLKKLKGCRIVVCATRARFTKDGSMHAVYHHVERGGHKLYWIRQPVLDADYEKGHEGAAGKVDVERYRKKHNRAVVDLILDILTKELDVA